VQVLPAQPKPAKPDDETATSEDVPSSVIELVARTTKPKATEVTPLEGEGRVIVRPKPEKRKNAKERAKEKYTKDGTTPDTTAKAKSKVETKPKTKAKKDKPANKVASV
jgi:hypothetical protein